MNAIIPIDEHQRMLAVRRYDILDTPPDGAFDRITALAARRFNVPIAIISVVDTDRIWFKSHHGLPVEQIDRKAGLCASAILAQDPHILEDASTDIRSLANPLVAGDFGLRFYAGVPLQTSDGFNLGTLCVIDKEPRTVDQGQIDDLTDLASIVMDQLELRLSARNAVAQAKTLAQEIDHRVMNSLQFISSMLKMQSRSPRNDAACQLEVAANRVSTVARVHRHFSAGIVGDGTDCLPFIKMKKFLRKRCSQLASL
jgi:GAF domain-containing protein